MSKRDSFLCFIAIMALLVFAPACYAEPRAVQLADDAEKEILISEKPTTWLEKLLKEKRDLKKKSGTSFAVLIDYQQQVILSATKRSGKSLGSWYYNLEIQQDLWWPGAWIVADLEGGAGKSVDKYLPTFSVLDCLAGETSLAYVPYLMFGQNFLDDKIYLAAGKLSLGDWFDINEVANSSDTQFMSLALVNNITIPFPENGIGFVAGAWFSEWAYAQFGVSDAAAKADTIGLTDALEEAFFLAETGITPTIGGRKGNYRVIYRFNRQRLDFVNSDLSKYGDWGIALSCDQEITKKLTVFMRYGFTDQEVRDIQQFLSAGFQVTAPLPGRNRDVFAFGFAQSITGLDYRKANGSNTAFAETLFETYYSIALNELFTLTTNFQVVLNPDADKKSIPDVVCGARLLFLF